MSNFQKKTRTKKQHASPSQFRSLSSGAQGTRRRGASTTTQNSQTAPGRAQRTATRPKRPSPRT
jgi:hypothetical protein